MTPTGAGRKAAIVFDVNVLIDAADPNSRDHAAAVRALSDDNGMPIYFSDTMLRTTANKLLELGADPTVVHEYLELIMEADEYGPEKYVLEDVPVTDYGLLDKYGKADYEDSTIISLMDAAEAHATLPAVLVSNDGALRDWCGDNHRMAVRPDALPRLSSQMVDEVRHATYQYTSRRMFRSGAQKLPPAQTKAEARHIVASIRTGLGQSHRGAMAPAPRSLYSRFPELSPEDLPAEPQNPHDTFQL